VIALGLLELSHQQFSRFRNIKRAQYSEQQPDPLQFIVGDQEFFLARA